MASNASTIDLELARLAARESVLRLLSLAASDPSSRRFPRARDERLLESACAAASYLAADEDARPDVLAPGEITPLAFDLMPLARALRAAPDQMEQDHVRVFGLVVSKECPPCEVQYCPQTFSIYRSQQMADIAGFYRAFGLEAGRDAPERVDHISCELELLAWLVAKERLACSRNGEEWSERAGVCRDAQRSFVSAHVAWWVPAFAHALSRRARSLDPVPLLHVALADALAALVPIERALLDVPPPEVLARAQPDAEEAEGGCGR